MTTSFKELHKLVTELSPEEIQFIRTKLSKNELEKVDLLNGNKTMHELNTLQRSENKISDNEVEDLTGFLKSIVQKENKLSSKSKDIKLQITKDAFDINKMIIGPEVEVEGKLSTPDALNVNPNFSETDSLGFIYKTIINYLEEYRTSYDTKILQWLNEMEGLYNKRLYKASLYYLENSYKLASLYEDFENLDKILKWKKRFVSLGVSKDVKKAAIDEELLSIRIKAANYWQYKILNQKVINGKTKVYATEDDKIKTLEDLTKDPLLQSEEQALSTTAKMHFHEIAALISMEFTDFKAVKEHWKAMIGLFEKNAQFIHKKVQPYIYIIHNYLNLCLLLNQFKEMERGIEVLDELPKRFPHIINRMLFEDIKLKVYSHKFNLFAKQDSFYKCFKMTPEVDYFLSRSKTPLNPLVKSVLYFDLARILHLYDKYDKAIQKLDQIIAIEEGVHINFKLISYSLKLICLIDLNSQYRLERDLEEVKDFFKENKIKSKVHQMILHLALEVLASENENNTQKIFKKYHQSAKKFVAPKDKHIKFNQFDLVTWLFSKVEGKRFLTLVKENAKIKL